ncbi:DUF4129 domain-containing protein [Deinococcus altitudinis]|uniref:DUF4129 domain-containing protein n=1 Tax=Deinococcus altitudinis TaxID=468914 RepID=UPI003891A90F
MSAPSPGDSTDHTPGHRTEAFPNAASTRPDLRSWLPALLPFTALGLLPWWCCLALSAALALGRLNDDSRSISALLALLAAVLVSGPLLLGTAPGRLLASGTLFAQAAVVGLLALASLRALENGQRRGLLLPAAALLLFPSPGGLVALLLAGLGLSGPETRPTVRLDRQGGGPNPARRMLALPLAAALALAGAGLLLGQVFPAPTRPAAEASGSPAMPRPSTALPASPAAAPPTSGAAASGSATQTASLPDDQSLLLRPLVPVTGLLVLVCIVLLLQRIRLKRAERRSTWTDYAALAAMLGTLFMVGVIGAGAGPGGLLGGPPPAAGALSGGQGSGAGGAALRHAPAWVTPLLNTGLVFATLFFAAAAVYLFLTLRSERGEAGAGRSGTVPHPAAPPPLPPLHRVRLAWRGLETMLAAAGLTRLASETPEEFTSRLSGLLPAAAADLHTLTRLYLPVRYGGVLSEADADAAEASAERVRVYLAAQPLRTGAD